MKRNYPKVRYPWNKWLSRKKAFKIKRGKDFYCQIHSMAMQIRNEAVRRKRWVTVLIDEDVITVKPH